MRRGKKNPARTYPFLRSSWRGRWIFFPIPKLCCYTAGISFTNSVEVILACVYRTPVPGLLLGIWNRFHFRFSISSRSFFTTFAGESEYRFRLPITSRMLSMQSKAVSCRSYTADCWNHCEQWRWIVFPSCFHRCFICYDWHVKGEGFCSSNCLVSVSVAVRRNLHMVFNSFLQR